MKSAILSFFILLNSLQLFAQNYGGTPSGKAPATSMGIVVTSNDPETVWNTFRLANYATEQGDTVSVFLLGKGVEVPTITSPEFNIKQMMQTYSDKGGKLFACGTCLQLRKTEGSKLCPVSSLDDLYTIIRTNKIILTF